MLRDTLDSRTARRFRTGSAALDFVHTGGIGRWMEAELVRTPQDAGYWLALVLDLDADVVRAGPHDLAPLRRLREAVWQLAQAAVGGTAFRSTDVDVVNAAALVPPPAIAMSRDGTGRVVPPVEAEQALSALARDAVELFTGPLRTRVRTCAADNCELLFVDASRPGQRRWCSMGLCGSRVKMRRYRA